MPSRYRKTDRPRTYPAEVIAPAVKLARQTTIHHAARLTGLSTFTIRRHLLAAGFAPRRRGNLTNTEALAIITA